MERIFTLLLIFIPFFIPDIQAQEISEARTFEIAPAERGHSGYADTLQKAQNEPPRFLVGGYGEAVMQRMFYSDEVARYSIPAAHKDGKHGRFDLPHVVFYMSYDFGRGWKVSAEVEFEHGGVGAGVEIENEETGEYEAEVEKGGEVILEQFWIEKSWARWANLRIGHIIVPVGLTNMYHMPTEFFSVMRPEEESSLIPCTWHETGISFWGRTKSWRYEAMFIAGLDAERFNNANWVNGGGTSPYEYKIGNNYAGALRLDNYSVKGLRMGLSGYFGFSARNSLKSDRYKRKDVNGSVSIGAFDAVYDDHNLILRGNLLYGYLGDSELISQINKSLPSASPSPRTNVGAAAMSWYLEAGYDILSFFPDRSYKGDRLYVYGHYGYYNSMYKTQGDIRAKDWCRKEIISAGINYYPIKGLVVKAEYSMRRFKSPYNNEPTVSLGIGYSGFFTR